MATNSTDHPRGSASTAEFGVAAYRLANVCLLTFDNLELFCIEDLFFQQSIALIWIIHNMDLLKLLARELVVTQNTSVTMATNYMESFRGSVCTMEFGMVACQLAKVCVIRVSSWNFILVTVSGRVDFIIIISLIFGGGGGGGGGKLGQFGGGGGR